MKKLILFSTVITLMISCGNKDEGIANAASQQLATDTAGLAEYQSWKQQKEQLQPINMNGVNAIHATAVQEKDEMVTNKRPVKPAAKIIYRERIMPQPSQVVYQSPQPVAEVVDSMYPRPLGRSREAVSRNDADISDSGKNADTAGNQKQPVSTATTTLPEVEKKKEGWSKAAKGATIGAASGAVIGAIFSKNKVTGAVIGGVVGGVGGYAIGRAKDKKDGRYLVVND